MKTHAFAAVVVATFSLGISIQNHADDIEIYEGALGDSDSEEINPNVLFILDTSGSMTGVVASTSGDFDYDSTVDYGLDGDADDDEYIYVYDENASYTGVYFTEDQVVCQSMLDQLETNTEYPVYPDQALQWQSEIVTVGGTTTCTGGSGAAEVVSFEGPVANESFNYHGPWDVSLFAADTDLELDIYVPGGNRVNLDLQYFTTSWQVISSCSHNPGGGESYTCTVGVNTLPGTATQLRLSIEDGRTSKDDAQEYSGTFSYIETVGTCTTTGGTDTFVAEWSDDFSQSSDNDWVLECQGDDGTHGVSDVATNRYAAYCPDDACTIPNYTSNATAGINWASSGINEAYFYGGNYHDFKLNGSGQDISSLPQENKDTYCGGSTNGDYFIDTASQVVYQCQRKWEIMEAAVTDIATSNNDLNIGLMRFFDVDENDDNGGSVVLAMGDIESGTQRQDFIDEVEDFEYRTTTPLSETLYEAYLYYAGLAPRYEDASIDDANAYDASGNYISPITNSCQSNNIVYLTDGAPVDDGSANGNISTLLGGVSCDGSNCLDDLAGYMANNDVLTATADEDIVKTYTIGFDLDLELLEETAFEGKGQYQIASSYTQLVETFGAYLVDIALSAPTTLVAPAVSVNAFNELLHRDKIYYAVFAPKGYPKWDGNVKKYGLSSGVVVDKNGNPAVDVTSGYFDDESVSYWSDITDGAEVTLGGFGEQLTTDRRVFVNGSVLETPQAGLVQLSDGLDLSLASVNASTQAEASLVRDWILGVDVDDSDEDMDSTDANNYVADSLHSRPFVVTYEGTDESDARDVVFFTTNAGFLHAVDARNDFGTELWSYMPSDLVGNAKAYLDNTPGSDHVYGLDGESTVYTEEADTSTAEDFELEKVYIYQGMRRGGKNYYAWDVSDAIETTGTPIAEKWTIAGGVGDFADLGQTWSKMMRTKLSYGCDAAGSGCTTIDVLVFSGGYDEYYDDPTVLPYTGTSGVDGNALFIVDEETGTLLWSAGDVGHDLNLDGMHNSIPATPEPIDIDGDGDMDVLFAVDIAGKVWRVDFDETELSIGANYAQGGQIADLSDSTATGFLRFYNSLDTSLTTSRDNGPHFNLVVGSGYRAHPKDTDEPVNRLFVIYDEYVLAPKDLNEDGIYEYGYNASSNPISFSGGDLFAVTGSDTAVKGDNSTYGFYVSTTEEDEKILNKTLTVNSRVIVTSYVPEAGADQAAACGAIGNTGGGVIYVFDLLTGALIYSDTTDSPGIPTDPVIIITEDGPVGCEGTNCVPVDLDYNIDEDSEDPETWPDALGIRWGEAQKTYWRRQ